MKKNKDLLNDISLGSLEEQLHRNKLCCFDDIIGESEEIIAAKQLALKASKSKSAILITGESGSGKELFAQAIHSSSEYAKGPFVVVNNGALPADQIESELFGYEKGSFTDTNIKRKIGKFEYANGGTIFLDEIGDLTLELQDKLLHLLLNKRIRKIGEISTIEVDIQIIAATNSDLERMVRLGKFREELYYILNVFQLSIPPLRTRHGDIILLMDHFLNKHIKGFKKIVRGFTQDVKCIF